MGGEWPKNCEQVLTSGYDFADKEVELADGAPKWVDKVEVKNGNIVLTARQKGVTFILR